MTKTVEKKSVPVGLRLRPSLKKALDELAAADRRALATYIELVLEKHVETVKPRKSTKGR